MQRVHLIVGFLGGVYDVIMNKITNTTQPLEVEWHQLDLRYQGLRIHTAAAVRQLMVSIHAYGLLVPITVIASGVSDCPWVVVDPKNGSWIGKIRATC